MIRKWAERFLLVMVFILRKDPRALSLFGICNIDFEHHSRQDISVVNKNSYSE